MTKPPFDRDDGWRVCSSSDDFEQRIWLQLRLAGREMAEHEQVVYSYSSPSEIPGASGRFALVLEFWRSVVHALNTSDLVPELAGSLNRFVNVNHGRPPSLEIPGYSLMAIGRDDDYDPDDVTYFFCKDSDNQHLILWSPDAYVEETTAQQLADELDDQESLFDPSHPAGEESDSLRLEDPSAD